MWAPKQHPKIFSPTKMTFARMKKESSILYTLIISYNYNIWHSQNTQMKQLGELCKGEENREDYVFN